MKRRGRGSGGKKTRGEKTLQRRSRHRPEKTRLLIVCEGRETEPNYFRGLRDEEAVRERFVLEVRKGRGGSPMNAVEKAIEEIEKATKRGERFDEVWCVIDVEHTGQNFQLNQARVLAGRHQINLALSNPSFE